MYRWCLKWFILLFCGVSMAAPFHLNWRRQTKQDLIATHHVFKTQTAFAADTKAGRYQRWLEKGFQQSLIMARRVKSPTDYLYVLRYYINGFQDPHIGIFFHLPKLASTQWPGFMVQYDAGQFRVRSPYASPPDGAFLLSCDGKSARQLMRRDVFPYYGNPKLEAYWAMLTHQLMLRKKNVFQKSIKTCLFQYHGHQFSKHLNWRLLSRQDKKIVSQYFYRPPNRQFTVQDFGSMNAWVTVPGFDLHKTAQITQFNQFLKQLSRLRTKKNIVIDLRGNDGGDSGLGDEILSRFYGAYAGLLKTKRENRQFELWRVSKNNLQFIKSFALPLSRKKYGQNSIYNVYNRTLVKKMEAALKQHQIFVRIKEPTTISRKKINRQVHLFKGHLYLLTDQMCVSACLDFLDDALSLPNTTLIGQPTRADTRYIDNRWQKLLSGLATLFFSMKVIRHRPRADNQPYLPHYRFQGDITDTPVVKKWVARIINH